MTAAQQHRTFGASAEADGDRVIIQVGNQMVAMTPPEARRFTYYLARAYTRADIIDVAQSARKAAIPC